MCYNMVIYTMPSNVLSQFMPTVPSLFTYFTFSSCAKINSWMFKAGLFQILYSYLFPAALFLFLLLLSVVLSKTEEHCQLFSEASVILRLAEVASLSLPAEPEVDASG